MYKAKAYSAASATSPLAPTVIQRRDPTAHDVQIDILFCGICHSDLHNVRNEFASLTPTIYPIVPGHEIIGRVTKVGSAVTKFKPGDLVAVGCMVDSDGTCSECRAGLEQFCPNMILTFNSPDKHLGGVTYGGYSESIVVKEHFVLRVPATIDLAGAAPLQCAGVTTYSPMRRWGVTKGKKVGVVGLGGLGHMGVKFAKAFGAHVVVFTTSPGKQEDALRLGADEVVISRHADEMLPLVQEGLKALVRRRIPMIHGIRSLVYIAVNRGASPRMNHERIFRTFLHVFPLIGNICRKHFEAGLRQQFRHGLGLRPDGRPPGTANQAEADNPNQNGH
jgi:uncharacterized zinc-type alcohol dehydrogenase-like protein